MPTKRKTTKSASQKATVKKISIASAGASQEISYDTKTIITLLLLLFFYPFGLIFMWVWMKWQSWIKILVTLPFVLGLVFMMSLLLVIGKVAQQAVQTQQMHMHYQQLQQISPPLSPTVSPTSY